MTKTVFVMLSGVSGPSNTLGTLDEISISAYGDMDFAKKVAETEQEKTLDWQPRANDRGVYAEATAENRPMTTAYWIKKVTIEE